MDHEAVCVCVWLVADVYLGEDVVNLWVHEAPPVSVLRHPQNLRADLWQGWRGDVHVTARRHGEQRGDRRPAPVAVGTIS